MPTRRSTRSSARGVGPGPATASQRGKGRARKSARLAVMIKPEDIVEEEKEEPNPLPEPKTVKNSNNKETSNKSKSSADDFEDITSGNEFEAIDSDPDDVQIITSVTNKSKNNNTILEDISDCSINDNEPELEDISSEGSDNEDLAISCGSKNKKTKGVKKGTSKPKDLSHELQDSDESDKEIVKKAEDLTDDEKVALGQVKDEKLDDKIKAVDEGKLVETLAKADEESSDSVKIIESNVTEIDDSKDLHEDISDEEHDDIYDDFVGDDENGKLDVNDEKKQVDDKKEQADDEKEQADDQKDEDDDEKEQADDDKDEVDDEQPEDDGKLEMEEQYDEELEDGDGKLEVEDDEDQEDGDEVQDDEQDDEKDAIDDDRKLEISEGKETKIEDKHNGDENLEVEDEDDENCENEEEVDDEDVEEEGDGPEDSSKDDELKLETEDDEMITDVKSSEDDKIKGNQDDDEDVEEFDEDGDYVEEDDDLLTNDIEEEMETDEKDKSMETAESENKVVEETDDDKAKENTEKEDKVVEKTNVEDKTKENADKNEKSAENKELTEEKISANDDKLEGDDEEEWDEEEWDEEEWDEEMEEDENKAVNKDDGKIADTTNDDNEEKKIKKTEDKEDKVDDKIKEAEDETKKVELDDEDVNSEQNVKEIDDKSEETDNKVKNVVDKSIEKDIKIDKITAKDDEATTASSNVDTTKSTCKKPAANDSSSNKIESIKDEIPPVEKMESDVKKDETKESKLKLKPKLPAKKPPAPKNKPLMKENVAPAKTESPDTKSDDKTKLKTESVTKPTSEKSDTKGSSNDKNTTGLKSKVYTIPKLSSRKESSTEKSDESKKAPPSRRKAVKTPKPVIEFKKEDLEIAAKNNIVLKAVTVKVKRLPSVDKNGVSINNIEDYTAPKSREESKDLEQIDLSDGWKIMDEAVGDPASEKKSKDAEAKRPFYKKPYIRGIEKFRPAIIDLLKTIKGTIVGLDYMVEVWKEDGRSPPRYYCGACKTLKVIENLEDHLTSLTHKLEIMRVTSLDCWHRFPAAPPASWPEGYVNLLEELSKSLIQQPLDDKHVILVTSLHWYNLRRREIDERVRRVHHPSISSKMYLPLFEKLPKVENLGEVRKKRIASLADKNKEKTSPASSGTKKFESSSSKSCADKSGSSSVKPNLSKTTNTKKDDLKTSRTPATGSKGSSPGKKCDDKTNVKSNMVKKDSKNVDIKKAPIKNESSNQSKDKKPSVGGVGSGSFRGGKTSLSGGNDKSESATKSRRLSSPKRRRSSSPKSRKSDNRSPRRRSPIRRSSPRRSPINTRRSPLRRSSPVRRSSPQRRISPFQRRISPFRKMSPLRMSPLRSRPSPRRSPLRRLSPRRSPLRRLTPRRSPLRSRLSPRRSPLRRLSPRISPRRSPLRGSSPRRSPFHRNSPRRSPLRRLTPRRSRSPLRRLTPRRSPIRRSSPSRRSPVRISPPRKNSGYGDRSPLRRQRSPSLRGHRGGGGGVSPKNRSRSPNYFKARSPLPYKREGNVVVVDDEIMRGPQQQQQQPRMQPNVQLPDFNQRYDLFNQNVNPTLNYPISTDTGELFSQRGGIFASSAKRKPIISFDEDIVTSTKRSRTDPYQPDALEMSAPKMNKDKKGGNFWESWHKTHDEEAEDAAASQALQEEIWTKQRQNWPGVNPDVRGAAGYNRQLLGRDSISVTVFNKSEKPDILISKNEVGYGDANPSKPTAEEIWRQQVELASSGRPNALSELRRNPNDWIQTPIGTKDKQSYQPSISELMSKKEAYDSSRSSRNVGNFGRPNPASSLLGDPDIGNWSNPGNPRDNSFEGRLGSAPRHATDSWLNSDRIGTSPSGLLSSSRDVNPGSSSSSSRYGMVKTGTSSSVHPLAAAAFSGSGGLEITGGNSIPTTGRRGERNSQQWNAPIRSGADNSSNISSRVSGVNIQTKSLPQDSWRGVVGNNIMTASSGSGALMSTPSQQSWRVQQQQDAAAAAASILSKPPQEDLNVVAQKLNSTLTRILNDYKPTGGLFSNPALKMAQQRQDQGMFRPGPVGDKLSLAQNIALALTNMGMANVPQHELVAILQHLGLLGGGGQGMMPSGNRVMDDLRETVSRFERTFQYHRF